MKTTRLTEKNMANKLFCRHEQAIFTAYYKFKDRPCAKILAKRAGVSRSTLHRHHKTVYDIPYDYEEYLFMVYSRKVKKYLIKTNPNLKNVFLRSLVFVMSNREIFKALFKDGHRDIIKRMLYLLKPKIILNWKINSNLDKIYTIYEYEILGIIEVWYRHGFSEKDLIAVLDDIMYLTKTTHKNLSSLIESQKL